MNKDKLNSFHVKKYRSLMDVEIELNSNSPSIICGENNIGKTNVLRAMNLFFNYINDSELFLPESDIPHHIFYGSRSQSSKTELIGKFELEGVKQSLKMTCSHTGEVSYQLNNKKIEFEKASEILNKFSFLFIESNNVNLPLITSEVLEKEGLLPLDKKRAKQSKPLEKLREFIELAQEAIKDIEGEINKYFSALTDFDGILKGKSIKINFAEFDRLRDIVKTMTEITLYDGNDTSIASKGSGAQRAVFMALMQYVSNNSKKKIIWGIDEPEVFLQPKLQKKLSSVINEIVEKNNHQVVVTTHSQHFIKLTDLSHTYIFEGKISKKSYRRRPGKTYYETNTAPIKTDSSFDKASLIKDHLGIAGNDGWDVLPYNILVEGEEDKKYLELLLNSLNIPVPNIIWSGGASKIAGYLQFYNSFANDLDYKPVFVCIFDNDDEGMSQRNKIKPRSFTNITVRNVDLPRYDHAVPKKGIDWEIEDFLPPDLILKAVDQILQANKYKKIGIKAHRERTQQAHMDTQILKYAEHCARIKNPKLQPFSFDNEGRKKEVCMCVCNIDTSSHQIELTDEQKKFLEELVNQN